MVTAQVRPAAAGAGVGAVTLVYRVNYDPEQTLPMTAAGAAGEAMQGVRCHVCCASRQTGSLTGGALTAITVTPFCADASGVTAYRATIPAAATKEGDLLRWAVQVRWAGQPPSNW